MFGSTISRDTDTVVQFWTALQGGSGKQELGAELCWFTSLRFSKSCFISTEGDASSSYSEINAESSVKFNGKDMLPRAPQLVHFVKFTFRYGLSICLVTKVLLTLQ